MTSSRSQAPTSTAAESRPAAAKQLTLTVPDEPAEDLPEQRAFDFGHAQSAGQLLRRIQTESRTQAEKGRWFENLFLRVARNEPDLEIEAIHRWADWPERERTDRPQRTGYRRRSRRQSTTTAPGSPSSASATNANTASPRTMSRSSSPALSTKSLPFDGSSPPAAGAGPPKPSSRAATSAGSTSSTIRTAWSKRRSNGPSKSPGRSRTKPSPTSWPDSSTTTAAA